MNHFTYSYSSASMLCSPETSNMVFTFVWGLCVCRNWPVVTLLETLSELCLLINSVSYCP